MEQVETMVLDNLGKADDEKKKVCFVGYFMPLLYTLFEK